MNQSVIAVIDGTRARFFTLEAAEFPEYQSSPNLVEQECLTSAAKDLQGKDLWASTKTGRNRGSAGQAHGYDDHRQNHMNEFERSFAKEIAHKASELAQSRQAQEVLLVAEPQILGLVREVFASQVAKHLKVTELAKDLCKLKPLELHEYLAQRDLLPARKVAST